jgi:serine/threonine protein kinase
MSAAQRTEESIFAEALEQSSPADRAVFLKAACADDDELRQRVENLLRSHTGAGSFLRKSLASTEMGPAPIEGPGMIIGPYKLLQVIGKGGMGVVYMADQESPVRRRVALKIIKPDMDSRDVIARFEAERQALAMMDHQNIAKVLDAGTTDSGRPYFVMELVHGVPLTTFCSESRLTLRQRLELFVPVCQAIQHAHQKGVIHRDIKPSNILVTMYDDKPVPKVIDFGVAKAVDQRLTEKTLFTQYGTLVGTFEYMSPEQAQMNAFGVDTRSDIYSLGVLLYELLTGTTPLERQRLRETALHELLRIIKEEEPPRPSARLSSSGSLPTVAAACRIEPTKLPQLVSGELDWIVMKCLEKDRTRRYETANGLVRDVQRYLADEPVDACPPTLAYRFHKFARKHRGLLTTAASFAALLVVGVIVSTWLAAWALRSQVIAQSARAGLESALTKEQAAREEAETAKRQAESFSHRLVSATQVLSEGIDFYNQRQWASAHERYSKAIEIEPDRRTAYLHRGNLYTTLGLWGRAAEDYDQCFRLASGATASMRFQHALLKLAAGDEQGYRQACTGIVQQYGESSQPSHRYYVVRACVLSPEPVGDPADHVRRAEQAAADWHAPWTMGVAASAHLRAGNLEQAAARNRDTLNMDGNSPKKNLGYAPLAMVLHRLGKPAEAKTALVKAEQAFAGWTREIADGPAGTMPFEWWDWLEGHLILREAQTLITGSQPAEDPRLIAAAKRAEEILQGDVYTFMETGREHVRRQEWNDAADMFSKAMDILSRSIRPSRQELPFYVEMVQQPDVFRRLVELRPRDFVLWWARGQLFANRREWAAAAADHAQALEILRADEQWQAGGLRRPAAIVMHTLAALRQLAGDETGYRELCDTLMSTADDFNDIGADNTFSRVSLLVPGAVTDAALPLRLAERSLAGNPRSAWFLYGAGVAHYRAGQPAEAIARLEESLRAHPAWLGRGQNYVVLAMACQQLNRHDDARNWLAKAKVSLEELDQTVGKSKLGYAGSNYLTDWLALLILLPEAESLIDDTKAP